MRILVPNFECIGDSKAFSSKKNPYAWQICDSDFFKEEANFDACRLPTLVHVAYSLLDYVQMVCCSASLCMKGTYKFILWSYHKSTHVAHLILENGGTKPTPVGVCKFTLRTRGERNVDLDSKSNKEIIQSTSISTHNREICSYTHEIMIRI